MQRSLAGTRIRQRRRNVGLSQKDLAAKAGISPSYLNLIEHNRRAIAGRVMNQLARALDIAPRDLSEGPEITIVATLQEIANAADVPVENPEDLLARFPGWCAQVVQLQENSTAQTRMIEALGDRLTHDPYLSESLHMMLSSITAIRATASLMTSVDEMDLEQSRRFNANIHTESLRLSDTAQALVSYFDTAAETQTATATPQEEFDRFWQTIRPKITNTSTQQDFAQDLEMLDGPSRQLANDALAQFENDVEQLPLEPLLKIARQYDFEPDKIAAWAHMDLHSVFRRLSTLPASVDGPAFGLFEIDSSGYIHTRRPLPDFPLPRHTSACTLWPIYQSLQQPGHAILSKIALPSGNAFRCYAIALAHGPQSFGAPRVLRASMLIRPDPDGANAQLAGTVCKLCTRAECPGRSEPQIMAAEGS